MTRVGTAELKARLSHYLRQVRQGETILVLDRKEPIARLVPISDQGYEIFVRPAQGSLRDLSVPPPVQGGGDAVEDLLRERAERT